MSSDCTPFPPFVDYTTMNANFLNVSGNIRISSSVLEEQFASMQYYLLENRFTSHTP